MDVKVSAVSRQEYTKEPSIQKEVKNSPKPKSENLKDSFEPSKKLTSGMYNAQGIVDKEDIRHISYSQIRRDVQDQLDNFFKKYMEQEEIPGLFSEAKDNLQTYFSENPDALKQVQAGEIPDYWNVENTASRMFNILFSGYSESMDMDNFYDKARDMINQAYAEVEGMVGFELPDLVQDTKAVLLDALEQFKNGTSKEDLVYSTEV